MTKVGISKSVTKNMGNYESAKVEYWIEEECEDCERDYVTQKLSMAIDDYLQAEIEELMAKNKANELAERK